MSLISRAGKLLHAGDWRPAVVIADFPPPTHLPECRGVLFVIVGTTQRGLVGTLADRRSSIPGSIFYEGAPSDQKRLGGIINRPTVFASVYLVPWPPGLDFHGYGRCHFEEFFRLKSAAYQLASQRTLVTSLEGTDVNDAALRSHCGFEAEPDAEQPLLAVPPSHDTGE